MTTRRNVPEPAQEQSTSSSKGTQIARAAGSAAISTFHALNDSEPLYIPGSHYSTIRHTRPWVYYRGVYTLVPISILGSKHLPKDRRISLQRRGWRTGLLGWTVGSWVGGTFGKEIDVTPENEGNWAVDLEPKRREQYDKEINEFLEGTAAPKNHKVLETANIHVPVSTGDGYFRFIVYPSASSHTPIAYTASFRVGSLSLSSAQPRGASIVTLIPELILRSGSIVGSTAAWASFYAAFPVLKVAQLMPGTSTWGNWAMNRAYRLAGGDDIKEGLMERYQVEERRRKAEQSVYKNVPFGTVGVRTDYDLQEDAKRRVKEEFFSAGVEWKLKQGFVVKR